MEDQKSVFLVTLVVLTLGFGSLLLKQDQKVVQSFLSKQGYQNIKVTGTRGFNRCVDAETTAVEFTAFRDYRMTGYVCPSFFLFDPKIYEDKKS